MASSNRHWPSMFKSKPCNSHHQWQHDINSNLSSSTACHRSAPYTTVPGSEERSPEPKPRWNPKPEQIRILEAIFNSGMVNPPRDEIRKIRAQLQEYGQVGDANVFYWFQNRKSRSKNKLRHNQNSKNSAVHSQNQTNNSPPITALSPTVTATATATCSSSSSSDKSSPKSAPPSKTLSSNMGFSNLSDVSISNSPTANSVTQNYFHPNHELLPEPFFFPVSHTGAGGISNFSQGFCFSELSSVVQPVPDQHHGVGPCTSLLLSETMNPETSKKSADSDQDKIMVKIQPQYMNYPSLNPLVGHSLSQTTVTTTVTVPSPTNNAIQGLGEVCGVGQSCIGKSTVFINGVGFEVASGPFNVREAFGDEAVLIHSNGQPVLTNEWGLTLHSLQHGAYYYLI